MKNNQNEKVDGKQNKLPKIFLIMRIVSIVLAVVGLSLLIVGLCVNVPEMSDDGWFGSSQQKMGLCFGGGVCLIFSLVTAIWSFTPAIQRVAIKTQKYVMNENKEDLSEIADTSADISQNAITKTAKAVKNGLKDTKFCKHCGKEIDADSVFCRHCGKKQD